MKPQRLFPHAEKNHRATCFPAFKRWPDLLRGGRFSPASISFAQEDVARRQPLVAGLEGFLPPRDADRAGGHTVVDVDGREGR